MKNMNDTEILLAEKLKALREKNNYTQEDLAKILYVTRQTISGWERGRSEPDIRALQILAQTYNISIDELLKNVVTERFYYKVLRVTAGAMAWFGIILSAIMIWGAVKGKFDILPLLICFSYCVITNFAIWISFLIFDSRGY